MTVEYRRCRGRRCGAEIVMVPTAATGKLQPLDVDPTADGNVVLTTNLLGETVAQVLSGGALDEARASGRRLYMPHHATCPDVERFRAG